MPPGKSMTQNHPLSSDHRASNPQGAWLTIVSGERRGLAAAAARAGLTVLAGLYRAGLFFSNRRFRVPGAIRRASRPVVSVGNLTVGGTGKTPLVAHLAVLVAEMGGRPVILSRGYAAPAGRPNEEALELERLCPDVPHLQNPDRRKALEDWVAQNPCDVAILDDGFQHRGLARDLDIVLIDALRPFGFGHVLPRGLLREPLSALRRADLVIITRADLVDAEALAALKQDLAGRARTGAPVLVAGHQPRGLLVADGSRRHADWLRDREVAAACGIGNPEAFRLTLEQAGAAVRLFEIFPDHHAYTSADLDHVLRLAEAAGLKTLVTTGKDWVKWQPLLAGSPRRPPIEVAALEVAMKFLEGEQALRREIGALLHR
ncbi:MAG: tetraacyldisaccharide 4'-kinase [Planctomycetes bacterium]|nr:tetraacyldisaccharide 4'-kinase [Planctomycetota bacterium]